MNEWINEWMNKWMNEWMNEWINEWMMEWNFFILNKINRKKYKNKELKPLIDTHNNFKVKFKIFSI